MSSFLCILKSGDSTVTSRRVEAATGIDALRVAARESRLSGRWTAYLAVAEKEV